MLRSHTCGELRLDHVDTEATLCGWVDGYRDHGGGIFVDLRDRYGLTQVCFGPPDSSVELIERAKKGVVYSDFEDEIGVGSEVELPGTGGAVGSPEFAQFRKKAQHYLKAHLDEPAVAKVRSGHPLSDADLDALQQILVAAGIGDAATFVTATEQAGSFGLFIRSLVGLDRAAAKEAFAEFLDEERYSKNQIEFINLIINYLTDHGVVEPGRVYDSPFTAVAPEGPESLFGSADVTRIFEVIDDFMKAAA